MLNFEWFRTFKVIYETGTLSAAAQALFISQPGVSLHLSSLEAYTGYRLFEREPRKMTATERGTILYNFIIDHVNKLEEAEQIFHQKSKVEKPMVSVGMSYEVFQYSLESSVSELPFNLVTRFGEYPQMLQELSNGKLDLILTSEKDLQHHLEYTPFTIEKIVLICGNQTDTTELGLLLLKNDRSAIARWLAGQIWYTKAADMEYLKRFWTINFKEMPKFRPNYIVPDSGSILRCLSNSKGFALVPDFICKKELAEGVVNLAWEGSPPLENLLYFGKRKKAAYAEEIKKLEHILSARWSSLTEQVYDPQ